MFLRLKSLFLKDQNCHLQTPNAFPNCCKQKCLLPETSFPAVFQKHPALLFRILVRLFPKPLRTSLFFLALHSIPAGKLCKGFSACTIRCCHFRIFLGLQNCFFSEDGNAPLSHTAVARKKAAQGGPFERGREAARCASVARIRPCDGGLSGRCQPDPGPSERRWRVLEPWG